MLPKSTNFFSPIFFPSRAFYESTGFREDETGFYKKNNFSFPSESKDAGVPTLGMLDPATDSYRSYRRQNVLFEYTRARRRFGHYMDDGIFLSIFRSTRTRFYMFKVPSNYVVDPVDLERKAKWILSYFDVPGAAVYAQFGFVRRPGSASETSTKNIFNRAGNNDIYLYVVSSRNSDLIWLRFLWASCFDPEGKKYRADVFSPRLSTGDVVTMHVFLLTKGRQFFILMDGVRRNLRALGQEFKFPDKIILPVFANRVLSVLGVSSLFLSEIFSEYSKFIEAASSDYLVDLVLSDGPNYFPHPDLCFYTTRPHCFYIISYFMTRFDFWLDIRPGKPRFDEYLKMRTRKYLKPRKGANKAALLLAKSFFGHFWKGKLSRERRRFFSRAVGQSIKNALNTTPPRKAYIFLKSRSSLTARRPIKVTRIRFAELRQFWELNVRPLSVQYAVEQQRVRASDPEPLSAKMDRLLSKIPEGEARTFKEHTHSFLSKPVRSVLTKEFWDTFKPKRAAPLPWKKVKPRKPRVKVVRKPSTRARRPIRLLTWTLSSIPRLNPEKERLLGRKRLWGRPFYPMRTWSVGIDENKNKDWGMSGPRTSYKKSFPVPFHDNDKYIAELVRKQAQGLVKPVSDFDEEFYEPLSPSIQKARAKHKVKLRNSMIAARGGYVPGRWLLSKDLKRFEGSEFFDD